MKEKTCKNCGKTLIRKENTFCDSKCYREFENKRHHQRFLEGKITCNKTLKKHLVEEHGESCSECGIGNEWNNKPLTLEVDHIDGNSDNNLPNNLRLLCPNCHSQTETSRGANDKKETRRNKYLRKYKGY